MVWTFIYTILCVYLRRRLCRDCVYAQVRLRRRCFGLVDVRWVPTCADPESFVRGVHLWQCFLVDKRREDPNTIIGQRNVDRDDRLANGGFVSFHGIRTSIAKKPYSCVIFLAGGPDPPVPLWIRARPKSNVLAYMIEPRHEISNNVVCATSIASDQPAHMCRSDQSIC